MPSLLHEFHNSAMGGYSGFFRTYKRLPKVIFLGRHEEGCATVCIYM